MAPDGNSADTNASLSSGLWIKSGEKHKLSLEKYSIRLLDAADQPVCETGCTCTFSDGSSKKKESDSNGWITVTKLDKYEYVDIRIDDYPDDGERRVYFSAEIKQDDSMETVKRLLSNMGFYNDDDDVEKALDEFKEAYSLDLKYVGMSELIEIINKKYRVFILEEEDDDSEDQSSDPDESGERT